MAVAPLSQLRTMPVATTTMTHQPKTPSRPSLAQRRSTLKRSADELGPMNSLSSPSKKSRVTFDADIDILSADDDDELNPHVVREQVRRAIQRHLLRDDEEYDKLRALFADKRGKDSGPTSRTLQLHLQALLANISIITRDCSGLVHTMLDGDWIGRSDAYFVLFVKFLGNLAAAHGGYLGRIMATMVTMLGPQKTRRIPGCKPVRQSRIHRRALQTCQFITQLVPTASASLVDSLAARLDFDFAKPEDRMTYVRSAMDLIRYVPELTSDILTNVLRQLIKLDTTIQADLDEEDDDIEEEILQHMSTSQTMAMVASQGLLQTDASDEDDDEATSSEESDMEEEEEDMDPVALRRKQLNDGVKQVDTMMDILFQYYTRLTTSSALQNQHQAVEQLNAQFLNLILPTYRSRHPQFLIFHFAQSDPIIVDKFIASCVSILVDTKQPPMHRHAAAAYFSGLVGRGAHVPPSTVSDCLYLLCDLLNSNRLNYESRCSGPDLRRFGDFYSTFQAIMYMFCMRWRDIASVSDAEDDDDFAYPADKNTEEYHFPEKIRDAIHSAIYSPLNPLRICTPAIVDQFAKLTHYLKFLYVYPKIEENKRVRIFLPRRAASDSMAAHVERDSLWVGENGMLEGFFPFDPYHLPISKHWIEGDYLPWQGLPGDEDDSDLEDDSESDNEDIEDEFVNAQSDGTDDSL